MPKVSVIIPVYNAQKFISETIDSVLAQTYTDWEIIAVDDGSTDRSPEILRKYAKMFPKKIRVITQRNSGVSIARNVGISEAKGEYIAFLDHDDLWLPKKLEKQLNLLDSKKNLGLVYCDSYIIDERGNIKEESVIKSILSRNIPIPRNLRGNIFEELFYVNYISLETVVTKKSVLDKVGMFDPRYKIAEDIDLFLKIARNYSIDFVPEKLSKFRVHPGGASRNIELRVLEEFQIVQYWLDREPSLKTRLRDVIRLKKAILHGSLIKHYLKIFRLSKMFREMINLLKDAIAPI